MTHYGHKNKACAHMCIEIKKTDIHVFLPLNRVVVVVVVVVFILRKKQKRYNRLWLRRKHFVHQRYFCATHWTLWFVSQISCTIRTAADMPARDEAYCLFVG